MPEGRSRDLEDVLAPDAARLQVVRRAQGSGQLRADLDPADVTLLMLATSGVAGDGVPLPPVQRWTWIRSTGAERIGQ